MILKIVISFYYIYVMNIIIKNRMVSPCSNVFLYKLCDVNVNSLIVVFSVVNEWIQKAHLKLFSLDV